MVCYSAAISACEKRYLEDSSGPLEAGCDKLRGGHQRMRVRRERWRRATDATSYNAAISACDKDYTCDLTWNPVEEMRRFCWSQT